MSFAAHSGTTCATEQLNVDPRPPRQSHTHGVGTIQGWGLFRIWYASNTCTCTAEQRVLGNLSTIHVPKYSVYGLKISLQKHGCELHVIIGKL